MLRIGKSILILFFLSSILAACTHNIGVAETSVIPIPTIRATQTLQLPPTGTPEPTTTPTQTVEPLLTVQQCLVEGGEVTRTLFQSALMKDNYEVSIYLPPCYGSYPDMQYPVLYLLHGQNQDDTFWLSLGVKELADAKIAEGAPPFLMVMPREVKNFDPVSETKFPDSIIKELIPWVEDHYKVCTTRDCRAVGGISRGGGWAMRLAMRNFDTFIAVGAHSMGFMEGTMGPMLQNMQAHAPQEFPRIWIDQGEEDGLIVDTESFVRILKSYGIPYEYHVNPGNHDKKYWQAHVEEYLDWYIQGWE